MNYLFTSESVSEGHPDKVADQISDAILDELLAYDPQSKVACETLVTTGQVVIAGEAKSNAYVDLQETARRIISQIGYNKSEYGFDAGSCGVLSALHEQSDDINRGVEREKPEEQGAGDQGMMFGYACNETPNFMPLTLDLAHLLLRELASLRKADVEGKLHLRPDAKSQVTVEYDGDSHKPVAIRTIVLSTQHDEFIDAKQAGIGQAEADAQMQAEMKRIVKEELIEKRILCKLPNEIKRMFDNFDFDKHLLVNPTGKFVIGGPHGDTGLTGRKIIVDTYGGRGAHGGGAFSGKDPSKVDRSAAYAARHMAKNAVAAGIADQMLVQLSYAIGKAEPINVYVNTYSTGHVTQSDAEIANVLSEIFTLTPHAIEKRLKLRNPIYEETAAYGHMGREPRKVVKHFETKYNEPDGEKIKDIEVELFTWEKLDYVDVVKKAFGL